MAINLTPLGGRESGVCPCCGSVTKTIWGSADEDDTCFAVYYVHWSIGEVLRHGAHFDLIFGEWDENAVDGDRRAVSLAYRIFESRPSFMVVDAAGRDFAKAPIAGQPLGRNDVIGTPIAEAAFAMVDTILFHDARAAELRLE